VKKEVQCPWCGDTVVPEVRVANNDYGEIKERKCPKCKGILAAYLDEKRTVLAKVRSFSD
jgi:ribosomal protein S27AE